MNHGMQDQEHKINQNILEVVVAHFSVEAIALHTLKTSISKVLAWIEIFAGRFAGRSSARVKNREEARTKRNVYVGLSIAG